MGVDEVSGQYLATPEIVSCTRGFAASITNVWASMRSQIIVSLTTGFPERISKVWALMKAQVTALVSLNRGFAARIN